VQVAQCEEIVTVCEVAVSCASVALAHAERRTAAVTAAASKVCDVCVSVAGYVPFAPTEENVGCFLCGESFTTAGRIIQIPSRPSALRKQALKKFLQEKRQADGAADAASVIAHYKNDWGQIDQYLQEHFGSTPAWFTLCFRPSSDFPAATAGAKLKECMIERSTLVHEAARDKVLKAKEIQDSWTKLHVERTDELKQLQEAKKEANRQEATTLEARLAELKGTSDSAPPDELGAQVCAICHEEPKDTLFLPCRHMCACSGCSQQLVGARARCPVCRSAIDQRIEGIFQ
jgi:E3 ubiquitin-protein ligase MUL1